MEEFDTGRGYLEAKMGEEKVDTARGRGLDASGDVCHSTMPQINQDMVKSDTTA